MSRIKMSITMRKLSNFDKIITEQIINKYKQINNVTFHKCGVSRPKGLLHLTDFSWLNHDQSVDLIPGRRTCVLEQAT